MAQVTCWLGDKSCASVHAATLNRATADRPSRGTQSLLQLQRQYGNRYVQRMLAISRQAEGHAAVVPESGATIRRARGRGQALDSGVCAQMEPSLGADLSGVRVHTNAEADTLNQVLNARAFTAGQDIFFRQGAYNPGSSSGRELLAHELTHAVQQAGAARPKLAVGQAGDVYEQEADGVARAVRQREGRIAQRQANAASIRRPTEEEKDGEAAKKPLAHVSQLAPGFPSPNIQRKIDFEFDLNYGMEQTPSATDPPNSSEDNEIDDDEILTTHDKKNHGFKVIMDGNRIEISTKRFGLGKNGRKQLTDTTANIMSFVAELEAGCGAATPVGVTKPSNSITNMPLDRPRHFKLSNPAKPNCPVFPLGMTTYFRQDCGVSASPQATFDVPLGSVSTLVSEIKKSARIEEWAKGTGGLEWVGGGEWAEIKKSKEWREIVRLAKFMKSEEYQALSQSKKTDVKKSIMRLKRRMMAGYALTGTREFGTRPGVKSDALFYAQTKVESSRKSHLNKTTLSDGTLVTDKNFTENLQGFMILLVSYLRASKITYWKGKYGDYEAFAKAYPPIVTHTRFRDMYNQILTPQEKKVFDELYGKPQARKNLYKLAGGKQDGSDPLFPKQVKEQQEDYFGRRLTWDDIVSNAMGTEPIRDIHGHVVKEEFGIPPTEAEVMFTPLARAKSLLTKKGKPKAGKKGARVKGPNLELRRIGFTWVPASRWKGLTDRVFELARILNGYKRTP